MVSQIERIAERRQIAAIIKADEHWIVFRRRLKIETPGGGWRWGPEDVLLPQKVALIPFKRRMTDFLVQTELGEIPNLPYVLLGHYDLDIEPHDLFTFDNQEFEVKTVDLKREIRVAAQVDYYGKSSNG